MYVYAPRTASTVFGVPPRAAPRPQARRRSSAPASFRFGKGATKTGLAGSICGGLQCGGSARVVHPCGGSSDRLHHHQRDGKLHGCGTGNQRGLLRAEGYTVTGAKHRHLEADISQVRQAASDVRMGNHGSS